MNSPLSEASADLRAQGTTALASDVEQRLPAMQSARKEAAKAGLFAAVHQRQLDKSKDLTWHSADGGFVCSLDEVQAYIQR